MALVGLRFCHVAPADQLAGIAGTLQALGLENSFDAAAAGTDGAVFPTGDGASWAEFWPAGAGMPEGTMLQLVVDDADAHAEAARAAGLDPQGPMDAHGERIYMLTLPGGLPVSFQSPLPAA